MATETNVPLEAHVALSEEPSLDTSTTAEPNRPERGGSESTTTEHVKIEIQSDIPDVEIIPETESITMDAPIRSSIDNSFEEARERNISASLTDRTRTSSKNLFKQESMTALSTASNTASGTQTGTNSSSVFPHMTPDELPNTPQSDSESKPKYLSVHTSGSSRKSSRHSTNTTKPAIVPKRNAKSVEMEIFRKHKNFIRQSRKAHLYPVTLIVYVGLLLLGLSLGLAGYALVQGKMISTNMMLGIVFACVAVDCVLSLAGELSLAVRLCFRWRGEANFNPQLYFVFQLARRPIIMSGLAVFWWFFVQDAQTSPSPGRSAFAGRSALVLMAFIAVWEAFVLYMGWDEHAVFVLLNTYDWIRSKCGMEVEKSDDENNDPTNDDDDLQKDLEEAIDGYYEVETETGDPSRHEVPLRALEDRSSDDVRPRQISASITADKKTTDGGTTFDEALIDPDDVKQLRKQPQSPPSRSSTLKKPNKRKDMRRLESHSVDQRPSQTKSRSDSSHTSPKSVRSRIRETGEVQVVRSRINYLGDDDYGQEEMSISLSASRSNERVGKWKAPPRRKPKRRVAEEAETLPGEFRSQRQADRERRAERQRREKRRSKSPRRSRRDETGYYKPSSSSQVVIVGGGNSRQRRSKSPRK